MLPEGYTEVYESAPHLFDSFERWLCTEAEDIPVALLIKRRTTRALTLVFSNCLEHAEVSVVVGGIDVYAMWEGRGFDILGGPDQVVPVRSKSGRIVCMHCDPLERLSYSTIEAFWKHELFECLLRWIKTTYAPAQWLALYRKGGSSCADLSVEEPASRDGCLALIDLRLSHRSER